MLKIIKPLEISTQVMSLIDDAEKTLIIVSPYIDIVGWNKMKKILRDAVIRDLDIKFYVRKNTDCDLKSLQNLGIEPIVVPNLHTKLYISEKKGIITSQNMTKSSDDYSIDFGHETEDLDEIQQLKEYTSKYLDAKFKKKKIEVVEVYGYEYNQYIKSLEVSSIQRIKVKLNSIFDDQKYYEKKDHIIFDNLISKTKLIISENLSFRIDSDNIPLTIKDIGQFEYSSLKFNYKAHVKITQSYFYIVYQPTNTAYNDDVLSDYLCIIKKIQKYKSAG